MEKEEEKEEEEEESRVYLYIINKLFSIQHIQHSTKD
jgi:hypothetical protein